ncbi:mechanosensitive ion channel family protein [Endozoicomonas sp. SM1973]|uniref:Small-conductance mechanosensitive channel n=1 Tax=Spartinivicinus marinus TaxID=2994442 RepID=A0A853I3V8_9GAMM|nr:mechanosensitive ion channel family protein [Spartinivicinus marinus]MCX4026817.1 mechanosensitive ion channel family protein [Spartinivicinus marinus]NYZ64651.1 mechanosensitive ion channel family protein [Spartinivicinus marinus]
MNSFFTENKLIASVVVIAIILVLRWIVIKHLQQRPADEEELPRKWINSTKNAANLLIGISLIIIWISELRLIALSIATFVVALVIATREFIQSFFSSLYHASARTFAVGDWIVIGSHCGEVVKNDWLSTTLLEVDLEGASYSYTGKTLVIPNNQLSSNTIKNLNFMRRYVTHSFSIVRDSEHVDVCNAKAFILEKIHEYCAPFNDVASRYNSLIGNRMGVDIPGPEPSVRVSTNSVAKNVFSVSFFCPTHEAVKVEQQVIEAFMRYWYEANEKAKDRDKDKDKKESKAKKVEKTTNTAIDIKKSETVT